jgi:hydrogenase-4 component F
MLAYSSIEHAGIMLLGFGFGGIGIFGALLHMMYHAFAKSLLFFLSSNIALKYSSSKIAAVTGMIRTLPYTSILYLLGFFAIVGIPPSGIFFSEFYIVVAGFTHYVWISVAMIIALLLVFAGLFRHVYAMVFGNPPADIPTGEINNWTIVPVTVLAVLLILAGIYIPNEVMTLLKASSALFMYSK